MSLVLSMSLIESTTCDKITIGDTTGLYDVVTNPGGWGAPNYATSQITSAVLEVTDAYHLGTTTYDFFADLADYLAGSLEILSSDIFGAGVDSFSDGSYTFNVVLTILDHGVSVDVNVFQAQAFFCNKKCCVLKKLSQVTFPLCDQNITEMAEMLVAFDSAYAAACCGKDTIFTSAIAELNRLCSPCGDSQDTTVNPSTNSGCCH